jgi:hypothetical protein
LIHSNTPQNRPRFHREENRPQLLARPEREGDRCRAGLLREADWVRPTSTSTTSIGKRRDDGIRASHLELMHVASTTQTLYPNADFVALEAKSTRSSRTRILISLLLQE